MTTEQFTYWLQGYSEICGETPNEVQWQIIRDHLNLVFDKQTPVRNPPKDTRLCETKVLPFRACGDASLKISGLDKDGKEVYGKDVSLDILATSC